VKKLIIFILVSLNLFLLNFYIYAAINQQVTLTATVPAVTSISLVNCSVGSTTYAPGSEINLGTITPQFEYIDTPNSTANDPWQVAPPIKISLAIHNNTSKYYNIFIQTDHKTSNYWTNGMTLALEKMPTADISGLINTSQFANTTSANYYKAFVPLRAWADNYKTGIDDVASIQKGNWAWVLDKSMSNPISLGIGGTNLINGDYIDVYLRSCWNKGKMPGTYRVNIKLIMSRD
jgi:hypothetical protein